MTYVRFTVYGNAAPAGSKTSGARADGSRFVRDSSKRARPWKENVAQRAGEAMGTRAMLTGPLTFGVTFTVARPLSHYGKRGLLPSAPRYPAKRPDITKLLRAVEDALTGVVWRDDAQVVEQTAVKVFGEPERCEIHVADVPVQRIV